MKQIPWEMDRRAKDARAAFRRARVKLTHQRLEIFREIIQTEDHPHAEAVCRRVRQRMPSLSLDTVYRTLWLFIDLGLITTLGTAGERVRFDGNMKPHHHFVCTLCGKASDFECGEFDALKAPDGLRRMGRVESRHVEFRGRCRSCLIKKTNR